MAYHYVMHALDKVTMETRKEIAQKLGVKQKNLDAVSDGALCLCRVFTYESRFLVLEYQLEVGTSSLMNIAHLRLILVIGSVWTKSCTMRFANNATIIGCGQDTRDHTNGLSPISTSSQHEYLMNIPTHGSRAARVHRHIALRCNQSGCPLNQSRKTDR